METDPRGLRRTDADGGALAQRMTLHGSLVYLQGAWLKRRLEDQHRRANSINDSSLGGDASNAASTTRFLLLAS